MKRFIVVMSPSVCVMWQMVHESAMAECTDTPLVLFAWQEEQLTSLRMLTGCSTEEACIDARRHLRNFGAKNVEHDHPHIGALPQEIQYLFAFYEYQPGVLINGGG